MEELLSRVSGMVFHEAPEAPDPNDDDGAAVQHNAQARDALPAAGSSMQEDLEHRTGSETQQPTLASTIPTEGGSPEQGQGSPIALSDAGTGAGRQQAAHIQEAPPEIEMVQAAGAWHSAEIVPVVVIAEAVDVSAAAEIEVEEDLQYPEEPGTSGTGRKSGYAVADSDVEISIEDAPPMFTCPISMQIMRNPVLLPSGQTYEKSEIRRWLKAGNRKCPASGIILEAPVVLVPNVALRQSIQHWCQEFMPSLLDADGKVRHLDSDQEEDGEQDAEVINAGLPRQAPPRVALRSPSRPRPRAPISQPRSAPAASSRVTYWSAFLLATLLTVVFLGEMAADGWHIAPLSVNPHVGPHPDTLVRMGALVTSKLVEGNEWLRVISAGFLSTGVVQLGASVLALFVLCPVLVDASSNLAVLGIFGASAVAGVLVSANMSPGWVIAASSAGVFGLIGASWAQVLSSALRTDEYIPVLLIITGLSATVGLMPYVDNWAHAGSMFVGAVLWCVVLLGYSESTPSILTRVGQVSFMLSVCIIILFCVVMLICDMRLVEHCTWCHHLTCVETRWWTCSQMIKGEVMTAQAELPPGAAAIRWKPDKALCLDGNSMKMRGCKASGFLSFSQQWVMEPNGAVRLDKSSLCLDNRRSRLAPGNILQLWRCSAPPGPNQRWSLSPDGHLYLSQSPGWCASLPAGHDEGKGREEATDPEGQAVVLAACDSGSALQRFEFGAEGPGEGGGELLQPKGKAADAEEEVEEEGGGNAGRNSQDSSGELEPDREPAWPEPASSSYIMLRRAYTSSSDCLGLGHGGLLAFESCGAGFQQWLALDGGLIQLAGTNTCIDNYMGRLKRDNLIRLSTCCSGEQCTVRRLARQAWEIRSEGLIALRAASRWCMTSGPSSSQYPLPALSLSQCNPYDAKQKFAFGDFSQAAVMPPSPPPPPFQISVAMEALAQQPDPIPAQPPLQTFRIVSYKHPDMCLKGDIVEGSVVLLECDDRSRGWGLWEFLSGGLIRLHGTPVCLAVFGRELKQNSEIGLEKCNRDNAGHLWSYTYERLIRNAVDPGLCVDKNNKGDHDGQAPLLWGCSASNTNQIFSLVAHSPQFYEVLHKR